MKNVRCRRLLIDRTCAPSKIGTLKDISLFGSFTFPISGTHKDGVVMQSVAGVGTVKKRTADQMKKLSSQELPIAGLTGAQVSDEMYKETDTPVYGPGESSTYSVQLLHLEQEREAQMSHLVPRQGDPHLTSPKHSYALKQSAGKRTVFSDQQKDIMIAHYNRQRDYQIRADPAHVRQEMEAAGIPVVKVLKIC